MTSVQLPLLTKRDLRLARSLENNATEWSEMSFKNRERLYRLPYNLDGLVTEEEIKMHERERAIRGRETRLAEIRARIRRRLP